MNYAQYFAERGDYKPTWNNGDRVSGRWNGVPFVGSVGSDTLLDLGAGGRVTVLLDLPLKHDGVVKHVLVVKPDQLTARVSK